MAVADKARHAIYAMWDELADFEATQPEEARNWLLDRICQLVGAQNAIWSGWIRLDDAQANDPTRGWRPRIGAALHSGRHFDRATKELFAWVESGRTDKTTADLLAQAGTYRVNLLDARSPAGLPDRLLSDTLGYPYAIWAGIPVNADTEVLFTFLREAGKPMFGTAERDVVSAALRGLRWFHRRLLLAEGIGVASGPLSPTERQVLHSLLQGLTEKQIAAGHGHSPHTTHEYVKRVFRKFGVGSRAQLMALWLGKAA